MPENSPPNPAWKNQGASQPKNENAQVPAWKRTEPAASAPGTRSWQNQASPTPPPPGSSLRAQIAVGLVLIGVLFGGVVALFKLLNPAKPACLVLLGASYDVNLAVPHNVYGWHGLQALRDNSQIPNIYPVAAGEPDELRGEKSWDKLWKELPSKVEETVIVHLALHGGADANGAYLFLGDPLGREKLQLKKLFERLAAKWEKNKILLILEPAQVAFHWPSGMLQNHFVRELKKMGSELKRYPNLLVLCASDEDQVSWASEEWQRTVFSHYLLEGLRGAAHPGEEYARITTEDLYKYLKKSVGEWARANRGTAQTPILLGDLREDNAPVLVQVSQSYTEKKRAEAPGREFLPSTGLVESWDQSTRLAQQVPTPAVYSPHLWRRYRDSLVRWEQLERAGGALASISVLKNQCADLAAEMKQTASVDLPSVHAREINRALPLPAVLGRAADKFKETDGLIRELWAAPDEKRADILKQRLKRANVAEDASGDHEKLLYNQVCGQLLLFVRDNAEEPALTKVRVKALVSLLDKSLKVKGAAERPAEMNYLLMLLTDLNDKTPGKYVQKAVAVRLLAEEAALAAPSPSSVRGSSAGPGFGAHPYSEMIFAWIKRDIDEADKARRLGEDWLFGAGAKEWEKASAYLEQAAGHYGKALKDVEVLRAAFNLRDEALADLPYYAEWIARRVRDPRQINKMEDLVKQVDNLGRNLGELSRRLDFHTPELRPEDRNALGELMRKINADFRAENTGLQDQYRTVCKNLEEETQLIGEWMERETVLAVPLIRDAGLRMSLVKTNRRTSRKFHDGQARISDEMVEPRETALSMELAQKLALSTLVRSWKENHDLAQAAPTADPAAADKLAARFGAYWQALPDKLSADLELSSKNTDLKDAGKQLGEAAFLSRLLPGGAITSRTPFGPPEGMRRVRLHDFLLWQAQRAQDDHWFAEGDEPYYQAAAKGYAAMAQDLALAGKDEVINAGRQKSAKALSAAVAKTQLTLKPPDDPNWTSELSFPLTWRLSADPGMPLGTAGDSRGVPMYWLSMDSPLADAASQGRRAAEGVVPGVPYPLYYQLKNAKGEEDRAAPPNIPPATAVSIFRGQRAKDVITPTRAKATTLINHYPPEKAGLAFRLDKNFDYGALAIMIDGSGSMVMEKNKLFGKTRFAHAIAAVDATLDSIADNTWVSVLVFYTDKSDKQLAPRLTFFYELKRWDKSHRRDLIERLKLLEKSINVEGPSPIAKGLIKSLNNGLPRAPANVNGPKLVVALTDGDDNYSDPDAWGRPKYNDKIKNMLVEAFSDRGVELHVVCFNKEDDKETQSAREQFERAIDVLGQGSFKVQDKPGKLADELELAIRPKLYLYKGTELIPLREGEGKYIGRYERELQWRGLERGTYTAWLQRLRKETDVGKLNLNRGDFMVLTLKHAGRELFFERSLYATDPKDKDVTQKEVKDSSGPSTLITIIGNDINQKKNALEQLITIEEAPSGVRNRLLEQQSPGFVWLETTPTGSAAPGRLRWRRDYRYPAPAYSAEVEDWPLNQARSETRVWWTKFPPYEASYARSLERSLTKADAAVLPSESVGEASFRIESILLEKHKVGSDVQKKEETCLVVRVRLDNKKPVFIQLQPRQDNVSYGEEHRYYAGAGKYTAMFWNLSSRDQTTFLFNVISVDDFKRVSEVGDRMARFGPVPTNIRARDPVPVAGAW